MVPGGDHEGFSITHLALESAEKGLVRANGSGFVRIGPADIQLGTSVVVKNSHAGNGMKNSWMSEASMGWRVTSDRSEAGAVRQGRLTRGYKMRLESC